jgi:hypothetical protein
VSEAGRAGVVILTLGGFAVAGVLALAGLGVVNEATAAIFVLIATILWTRQDAAAREARVRATLAREIARNLDDGLPMLRGLRHQFVQRVQARLDAGEPLLFAFSPDEDISLKIYGPMIPTFEPELAAGVMAYFDAEKAVCDLLLRIEQPVFAALAPPRQREWLEGIAAVLDEAIEAGQTTRQRIAQTYGL